MNLAQSVVGAQNVSVFWHAGEFGESQECQLFLKTSAAELRPAPRAKQGKANGVSQDR
ncbi:hypothetical protein [Streptomyces sp. NPDC087294]|uniref:hypothetical protein n=1 Tax=Streptomyces sp. NPDC087294 TaxID=3365777 RepID=UPI0038045891